jgi:ribosomal protein S18 acetylase RimI-like enzyme
VDAVATDRAADAAALIFEYMAATQAENGQPVPACVEELPPNLKTECRDPHAVYQAPGALLLAYRHGQPIGCIGLKPLHVPAVAEIKRLYVRPAHRGGVGRLLMEHAHRHARRSGFTRLVLDVLPHRIEAIDFYRRLGYSETPPYTTEPTSMIYMELPLTDE